MEKLENIISLAVDRASIINGMLTVEIDIPPFIVPEAYLFAPKSRLTDTWTPEVEKIVLPAVVTVPGKLSIAVNVDLIEKAKRPNNNLTLLENTEVHQGGIKCDLRMHTPGNWAHTLTNHIPIAMVVMDVAQKLNLKSVDFILPKKLPGYCREAFSVLGVDILTSDRVFQENGITVKCDPWIAIRGIRHIIADQNAPAYLSKATEFSIPDKIYLSRRDTRKVLNENELVVYLDGLGFTRIYPEDYSVPEQLFIFRHAHQIVSIHGAGMAPILWGKSDKNIKIVELFPASYMTNVWRIIAEQKKWQWVGVRGKLWGSLCKHIYADHNDPRKYAMKNFEICMDSFASALSAVGI